MEDVRRTVTNEIFLVENYGLLVLIGSFLFVMTLIPDICLPVKKGQYSSLYIELKRRKGASVSKEQKEMIALLVEYGSLAVVCYGWEDAAKVIERYLKI